jgi:AbrB family looped-hinge helix DNA binding protein
MRISERGQITIPKPLRDRFGMQPNVEVEITPTEQGLLIQKRTAAGHPVDRVYAVLGRGGSTDDYIEKIRGR